MVTAHRAVRLGLSSSTNTVEASRACCPSLLTSLLGCCAREDCYSSCHPPASSQTDQSASCTNVSVFFVHLVVEGTFLPPSDLSCTLLPLSSPSFGYIFDVVLDFSQSRRCLWHGRQCSEVKGASCGSLSPDQALFWDVMGNNVSQRAV